MPIALDIFLILKYQYGQGAACLIAELQPGSQTNIPEVKAKLSARDDKNSKNGFRCAFCLQEGRNSGEHFLSKWMRGVREPPTDNGYRYRSHRRSTINEDGDFEFSAVISKKPSTGHIGHIKVRGICQKCNNTWMSQIDNDSKKYLTSALLGEDFELTTEAQNAISKFAILKSLVMDLRTPNPLPELAKERESLYRGNYDDLASKWRVNFGRYVGSKFDGSVHVESVPLPPFRANEVTESNLDKNSRTLVNLDSIFFSQEYRIKNYEEFGNKHDNKPPHTTFLMSLVYGSFVLHTSRTVNIQMPKEIYLNMTRMGALSINPIIKPNLKFFELPPLYDDDVQAIHVEELSLLMEVLTGVDIQWKAENGTLREGYLAPPR